VAEIEMVPQNYIRLEGGDARQMLKLMEALEDHDDVQKVSANFDISEADMAAA
jgi:transcriptional/translational regulatory protein YebC/TACO1